MSVPFSNTHLRIPRGFGTILNGLVREVLRDQPDDIPKYAAQYFSSLLKQREESGMDPAEWAARLEDTFYNNAFKDTEAPASGGMSGTKMTTYKGNYNESKPGEESREVSSFSTIQQDAPEGNNLTGGTEEQEEKHNITERLTPKDKLSEWESVNRELHGDEPSDAVEQDRLRILDSDNANAIDCLDVDHPDSEFTGISLGFSDDVACASPLTVAEDEGSQKGVLNKNIIDSNEKTEAEEQTEVFPHSGCPGVNVFEAQFEEIDNGMEGSAATGDRQKEGYEKPPHKDTSWLLFENLKSEHERPEGNKQQAEDQTETTEELQRLQTCSEETHDRFGNIEDSNTNKVDSSVEVSFEDLPEAQEITEFEEEQPEEQDAVEVLQTNMEMPPVEESKEIAAVAPDQKVSVTQDREHEMVGVETEANSEETEMKSQLETSVMKERVDTNDPNLSDEEDEMGEGDKVVSSSHQPTGTPESDNPEYENGHTHESSLKISEGESQQKEPNSEEAETTHVQNGDDERVSKQGRCKGGAENQSPQASQSNSSTGAPETETLETSVHHLSEEDKRGQGTALKAEPEVRVLEEPSESLELVEERTYDSKRQQDSRTSVKDSVSPDPPADEGEKGHSDKDTTGPEDSSGEKQEDCSRPQEEEDIMDIPLDDPEANRAAAKIQAGFRGHMTRKKLKPEDKAEGEERQEDRGQ